MYKAINTSVLLLETLITGPLLIMELLPIAVFVLSLQKSNSS